MAGRRHLRGLVFVAISIAAHSALVAGASRPRAAPPLARSLRAPAARSAARVVRMARIAEERAALVASAQADVRARKLALGEFLLHANALDAEERGAPFDLEAARKLYRARVDALHDALSREALRFAVPEVMGDLRYFGRPGGLMAEALLEGGGSCEQISQLVVAAAYDSGAADRVALRYYGGAMQGGASHLAAIEVTGADEHDLLLARPAVRKGTRFAPADLVEAYARVHGLAPPLAAKPARSAPAGPARDLAAEPDRASLAAGYPPNDDRFPGTLPLFAARAIADPADDEALVAAMAAATALEERSRAQDCASYVRMAALDPPAIEIAPGASRRAFAVELRKIPGPSELERKAALLRGAEDNADGEDGAARLIADACIAALGRDLAMDFALAGEARLAELSLQKSKDAAARGAAMLSAVSWDGPEGADLERRLSWSFAGQTRLLLFLEGGDRAVLHLARAARGASDWGRIEELASLVVAPATRTEAYAILDSLPRRAQIDVMHEVFFAHDHQQPWASSYTLDEDGAPEGRAFRRAYRVFRALAARFWERQIPPEQTLPALVRESRAAGLDPEWEALFLEYYGKNLIGLYRNRAPAPGVMRVLTQAVEANRDPVLDSLRRMLGDAPGARTADRPLR